MKNKILILILGLILLSSSVFGAEFNMSFDSYGYTGTWTNPTNYTDLDWSTFATASSTSTFYFNYTGQNCENYNWLIKDSGGTDTLVISGIQTLTPIELKTEFVDASNFVKYYYWTGVAWSQLKVTATGAAIYSFYEQILICNSTQQELLYYNFSVLGNSNEIVNDSAHNFNGELTNYNINPGEINGATISDGIASFDGVNDYITTSNLNFNTSGWINISFTPVQYPISIDNRILITNEDFNPSISIYLESSDNTLRIYANNGGSSDTYSTSYSLKNYNVSLYYNSSNLLVYIDGIKKDTFSFGGNFSDNNILTLGKYGSSSNSYFNGTIQNLIISEEEKLILKYNFENYNSTHVFDTNFLSDSTNTDEGFSLGEAMDFNSDNSNGIDINLDLESDSQTLSFWFKTNNKNIGDTVLVSGTNLEGSVNYGRNGIFIRNDGLIKFRESFNNGDRGCYSTINTQDNTWYFFQSITNGEETKLYINGELDNTCTMYGVSDIFSLGYQQSGIGWYYLNGSIDEFRSFNRVLEPIEIYSLYHYNTLTPPSEYTVFYAKHFLTNVTYQDFTINWLNQDTLETGSESTTEGFIPLLLSDSVTYEITITSNDFATQINSSFDSTLENYTFKVYDNNSVLINVYNEETNVLMENINVTMDYMINGFYNQNITNTSNFYLSELLSGLYEFRFSATDYYNRYYYLNIINSNHYLLNAYLIDTENGALRNFIAQCTGSAVRNATISVYKLINGNYVTIAQRVTDYTGLAPFYLNPATTYKIIITTEDYSTFTSSITPSSSPIAFDLCGEGSAQPFNWTTLYDLFSYLIDEETLIDADNHVFNLETSSPSGSIVSFGLTANGSTSIVTGSPAGGSTSITVNLTNITGTVPVTYMFNITGYDQYNFTKIFIIKSFEDIGNYSYTNIFEEYKDEVPAGWRYIQVTFIAVLLMTLLYKFLDPIINSFVGLFVFVTFVYFGWVSVVFLVPMGALLIVFYLSERGGF